ncbi:DUF2306 domain-containing protein [Lysobacter sp. Root983]|uniref:DUF2306 domain-containing protein n=1 Tax=Lysobacter sp. Root983 TaxID=1736613 RepID=UPI00070E4E0F|nr:DUF2306 domain-containing protein [Lysobacter sp. Root983]KRD74825.1 hypothetical protein ASE43_16575 [Lysobacter sp. Root983]
MIPTAPAPTYPDADADIVVAASRSPADTLSRKAGTALKLSASAWFVVAALGQLLFVAYVLGYYGRAALQGRWQAWNGVFPRGYVAGDTAGNLVVAAHLGFACLIVVAGLLQLTPAVRRRWPAFHRWTGRAYLAMVAVMSLGGLSMILTRGSVGDLSQKLAIGLNALLMLAFAYQAYRHARARHIDLHRRWALRLFLAVSGVWFFRIGLMFWIVANQGPAGFDPASFRGPFLTFLAFAQYLLPLAVLELYLRAQDRGGAGARIAATALLSMLTLVTAAGVGAATMLMWLPRL